MSAHANAPDAVADEKDSDGREGLRRAIIWFAVVEALVIAAVIFYKLSR